MFVVLHLGTEERLQQFSQFISSYGLSGFFGFFFFANYNCELPNCVFNLIDFDIYLIVF